MVRTRFGEAWICDVTRSAAGGAIGVLYGQRGFAPAFVRREVAEEAPRSESLAG